MTEYNLHTTPPTSNSVNEAKAERRKVLDGVYERRKLMYKQYNLRKSLAYFKTRKNSPEFD